MYLFPVTIDNRGISIAPDKALFFNQKMLIFFFFLYENIACGYSLEAPHQSTSNDYTQLMFSWRNKEKNFMIATLIWSRLILFLFLHENIMCCGPH